MELNNITSQVDEEWEQIEAGTALIAWSRLASWDVQGLKLIARSEEEFESANPVIEENYGRVISWIAFSVGAEYLTKGVLMARGVDLRKAKPKKVTTVPSMTENLEGWIMEVSSDAAAGKENTVILPTLWEIASHEKLLPLGEKRAFASASLKLLASAIRNRDAHIYAKNVRALQFHLVGSLFIPTFNFLLESVDQDKLRQHSASV